MRRERRYGQTRSWPIPVWNGILEHCKRIGPAIWVFLWLLDKVTDEKSGSGIGWCLGRAPIKLERIAADLCESGRTVQRHLLRLARTGYIVRRRTPFGYSIGVRNSCKFGAFRRSSDRTKTSDHSATDRTEMSAVTGHEWRSDRTEVSETKKTLQTTAGKQETRTRGEGGDDDGPIERLFARAARHLIRNGEDPEFVQIAPDFLDRRSFELGKGPPATVNWYLVSYENLKQDSPAVAELWQQVHHQRELREKYMPGFDGKPENELARQEFNRTYAESAVR